MLEVQGTHPDLHRILALHAHIEQIREYRSIVVHVLAISGGLCWIAADWPGAIPRFWRVFVKAGWPLMFLLLLVLVVLEARTGFRLTKLIGKETSAAGRGNQAE